MSLFRREPVAVFGAVQTVLLAAVAVLAAFDVWSPSDAQLAALGGLYAAITALATMFLRGKVAPDSAP